ncbi:RNAse P Rpr2/Rpp21/SNM1 subunit domain-containing protein [Ophiocordyceps camponoti-floridani]|uniref:RNAse P Rpr2/Rpp21/SNM1 subunit domain-containing protein n=1 Tax=Ophiocordyceps camponoti-floridani TaxID=2030778 RepID=A0A8H4VEN5_9HYPO|nr:RNAse P Rpr2/Rpp21/SNM1 subunit domain-containing protein [Ophiocordyceps camponoti-floridani]
MASIRFDVPDGCRVFTLFPRLPAELRHRIWEAYLCDPGVNFIKLQVWDLYSGAWGRPMVRSPAAEAAAAAADSSAGEELDDVGRLLLRHDCLPRVSIFSRLVSSYPKNPLADHSQHRELRVRLAAMAGTCVESHSLVRSLMARPGVLRLESGLFVSLSRSPDVMLLEYYPHELYKGSGTLNVDIFCPTLDLIRRLAVRYCHAWRPEVKQSWSGCKPYLEDTGNCPTHLYQFLARHLPSLREFYFVDYFIVPKTAEEKGDAMSVDDGDDDDADDDDADDVHIDAIRRRRRRSGINPVFSVRNRRFHDVSDCDPETCDWKLNRQSLKILDWLRDHFVRYASQSHTSRHKAPEKVYFGLLACEWVIPSPSSSHRHDPPKPRVRPPNGRRRGTPGGRIEAARVALARASRSTPRTISSSPYAASGPLSRVSGCLVTEPAPTSMYVFGSGRGDDFKFTFAQPYGGVSRWLEA